MEKVANTESTGNDGDAWDVDLAMDAVLRVLAMLDNFDAALFVVDAPEDVPLHHYAARAEALERVRHFLEGAIRAASVATFMDSSATAQREAVAIIRRAAREIRWRIATLSPVIEYALRADGTASPWDAPPAFDDHVLSILHRVRSGDGAIAGIAIHPKENATADGAHIEFNEHFARVFGSPLPATPSRSARVFAGASSIARAGALADTDDRSPGATWDYLCTVGVKARRERHPLAALLVFAEAAIRAGALPYRAARCGDGEIPRLVSLAVAVMEGADDRDGPRDLARNALRALGHNVADFTNAERAARARRGRAKSHKHEKPKPARDARKARK